MPQFVDYVEFTDTTTSSPAKIYNTATDKDVKIEAPRDLQVVFKSGGSTGDLQFRPDNTLKATLETSLFKVDQILFDTAVTAVIDCDDGQDLDLEATGSLTVNPNQRIALIANVRTGRDAYVFVRQNTTDLFRMAGSNGGVIFYGPLDITGSLDCGVDGLATKRQTSAPVTTTFGNGDARVVDAASYGLYVNHGATWRSLTLS